MCNLNAFFSIREDANTAKMLLRFFVLRLLKTEITLGDDFLNSRLCTLAVYSQSQELHNIIFV